METVLILWVLCGGLAYFIARDRAPSKAGLAVVYGFLFGPLGVGLTFLLKDANSETTGELERSLNTDRASGDLPGSESLDAQPRVRSIEEVRKDLARMKARISSDSFE
jgi:hypothetical protein